jgi:hypothetical protein
MTLRQRCSNPLLPLSQLDSNSLWLVIAWGAAQVADLLLGSFDTEAWVMQLTLLVLASGFPVTLVLAWVYEVRGDGIHRERDLVEETVSSNRE